MTNKTARCQDLVLVRVRTDEGLEGIGEADSSPEVVKAIIDAPYSHNIARGLRKILLGENPLETERLWQKMLRQTMYFGRTGVTLNEEFVATPRFSGPDRHATHRRRGEGVGRFVFCGSEDTAVERFNLPDGARTVMTGGHATWGRSIAFSSDGANAISGGCDGKITWWDSAAEAPTVIRSIDAHQGWIRTMDVSPDGTLLASGELSVFANFRNSWGDARCGDGDQELLRSVFRPSASSINNRSVSRAKSTRVNSLLPVQSS